MQGAGKSELVPHPGILHSCILSSLLLRHQLLDELRQQLRIVLLPQVLDPVAGRPSFSSAPTMYFHCFSRPLPSARYSSVTSSLSRCSEIASRFS